MAEEHKLSHEDATQSAIDEIAELKMEIVDMLKDAAVKFPVKNKSELKNLFPPGTKMACRVGGKETHFDELAETLDTDDFPLEDAIGGRVKDTIRMLHNVRCGASLIFYGLG